MQTFFINSRYIKSKTVQAALEEAYRSYIPSGKFPAAVLNIIIDYNDVDVNVHPAKTEVKFADEKKVFSAVYYGIKYALNPKTEEKKPAAQPVGKPVMEYHSEKPITTGYGVFSASSADSELPPLVKNNSPEAEVRRPAPIIYGFPIDSTPLTGKAAQPAEQINPVPTEKAAEQGTLSTVAEFTILGEAYDAYIFAQLKDKVIIVDKHAAHERILYENLRNRKTVSPQKLLFPITVTLSPSEAETLLANAEYLKGFGFGIDEFGPSTVAVREVPAALRNADGLTQILETFAKDLAGNSAVRFEDKVDRALYTMACKAALKAGQLSTERDAEYIIENILRLNLKYCPHGRPFVKEISKREIEKYFDR
jgi:DNA mismatch repair protein MutL